MSDGLPGEINKPWRNAEMNSSTFSGSIIVEVAVSAVFLETRVNCDELSPLSLGCFEKRKTLEGFVSCLRLCS